MATIPVQGLSTYKDDELLAGGGYGAEITNALQRVKDDGRVSLQVSMRIVRGNMQPDGSDPAGRPITDFIPLNGYDKMKDGGKFCLRKVNHLLGATGVEFAADGSFDEGALIGKMVLISVRHGKDLQEQPTADVVDYKKWE